jgi:tetratricopeptide (TPR) repeat protein
MSILTLPIATVRMIAARSNDATTRFWRWTTASTPILPRLQRPSLVVMPILFLSAMMIGVLVLPGENERIAALERDGQPKRALQMLEARLQRGDSSSRVLFDLFRLYDYYGDAEKARRVLEQLAEKQPRDARIQRQLAQLYKSNQDEPAYIRALEKQIVLRYSEPACKEWIGLLRRSSAYEAEQKAIVDCRRRGYRRADDLVRLAFLEASDGNMVEAAQTLSAVDDRRWLREGRERQLLFDALIEARRPDEALRRGVRWLKGQPDNDLANTLIYRMVEGNRNDLALQMATAVSQPGDSVSLTVAEIMIDQVQYTAARAFLGGWLQQNKGLDLELATRFLTAALDAEDPMLGLAGAMRFGFANLEQSELAALSIVLAATGRGREFDQVRPFLSVESIARNPILGASIELRLGRPEQARGSLMRVRTEDLNERQLGHFAKLVDQAGRSPALAAVLREPRIAAILPPSAAVAVRPLGGVGLGQIDEKQRILKRAEANKRLRERRKVERKSNTAAPAPAATPSPSQFSFPNQ